jgi:hypothetical protein
MHVCNISFQVDPRIEEVWLHWMNEQFIPSILATQCFSSHQLYELEVTADQGPTYTLQLFTTNENLLLKFKENHAVSLFDRLPATWGEQCFHFSSFMKSVD